MQFNNKTNLISSALAVLVVNAGLILLDGNLLHADTPDKNREVLLGMSTALSGPAASLGENMRTGILAAFHEFNHTNESVDYAIKLLAVDDGYEPSRTAPNMRNLIEVEKVLAIIGNVGTPTAIAAIPIANENKTPFFGAYTGAGVLRKSPPDRYVINYRASYAEETVAMVDSLINYGGLAPEEIAFFTQRDGYGDAGFVGGITALRRHGLKNEYDIAHGRYERNTLAVENGLSDILLHVTSPKAIIMVGAYAPCAQFIKLARSLNYEGIFLNVSFVGSAPLANTVGAAGEGVIITQVVPHPYSDTTISKEYRQALRQYDTQAEPTFGSFEGYIAARILVLAISNIEGEVTREKIVTSLEGLGEFDLGFEDTLTLSSREHQASHMVWPTVIRNGQVVTYSWPDLEQHFSQGQNR